jgi:hypothetical protein
MRDEIELAWQKAADCATRAQDATDPNIREGCVIRGSGRRTAPNLLPAWISISTRWSAVRREFLVIDASLTRTNSGSVRPSQARTPEHLSEAIDYAASRARSCGCE